MGSRGWSLPKSVRKFGRGQALPISRLPHPVLERGAALTGNPDRVAVIASWSAGARQSKSLSELATQLDRLGYRTLVISSSDAASPLEWQHGLPSGVSVYRRPNIGYDFGSWASALAMEPSLARAERLLLMNDSLVGPFAPIDPLIDRFERGSTDVWGLISTTQDAPHLQSHTIGYRHGVLTRSALTHFWADVRPQPTKRDLIRAYEIGYAPVLARAGATVEAAYPWQDIVPPGANPTSLGWRRLLLRGFPWIKRELVLHPPPEVVDRDDIPRVVRELHGVDVREWV